MALILPNIKTLGKALIVSLLFFFSFSFSFFFFFLSYGKGFLSLLVIKHHRFIYLTPELPLVAGTVWDECDPAISSS